jgi:transposase
LFVDTGWGLSMKRFIEGEDRHRGVLFPEYLDDWVSEENPVRAIDVFVDTLDLAALGFEGVEPAATGRPGYHPGLLLKLYVYGYITIRWRRAVGWSGRRGATSS